MKTIKRWTTTIASSFESLISQLENHDALVSSAIREAQEAGTRAKIQLRKVKDDGIKLRHRLSELEKQRELWQERAVKCSKLDESRALECLRREKRIAKELSAMELQERQHSALEKQLVSDLSVIDDRLAKLNQQRNLLRARQSRAQAFNTIQDEDAALFRDIDDVFDRWETKVVEYEIQGGCTGQELDDLEKDFSTQEEEEELKAALAELVRAEESHQAEQS